MNSNTKMNLNEEENKNEDKRKERIIPTKIFKKISTYSESEINESKDLPSYKNYSKRKRSKNSLIESNKYITRTKNVEEHFKRTHNIINNLNRFRKVVNRETRQNLLNKNKILDKLANCNSRILLSKYIKKMNITWKILLKKYVKDWMIMHLHLRQIKCFKQLMAHRQYLYEAIEEPEILKEGTGLENNLVKNFCKGFVQFVAMFKNELIDQGFLEENNC